MGAMCKLQGHTCLHVVKGSHSMLVLKTLAQQQKVVVRVDGNIFIF